jgi:hypothetical protein
LLEIQHIPQHLFGEIVILVLFGREVICSQWEPNCNDPEGKFIANY